MISWLCMRMLISTAGRTFLLELFDISPPLIILYLGKRVLYCIMLKLKMELPGSDIFGVCIFLRAQEVWWRDEPETIKLPILFPR